jgi:hypothetical protein
MNRDLLAFGGDRAAADGGVRDLQTRDVVHRENLGSGNWIIGNLDNRVIG